ncbi:endonuclease domain-containing protein [Caulobacter endophyticus]|uniref:endonuclease domain-containing protein n=1 Tax=Caulobacter endophyticus TaxID=2172652 RepID=UPI002410A7A3|nr:endonuclease domain-containing protein [Caulobacter endophyticus]MDG2531980.1 endonuclease domain-containing protein [Caulobacter endophyticus]
MTARTPGALHTSERADRSARRMRREPTLAEKLFWKVLKKAEIPGSHFRRQAPFGPYVVDFVCHQHRLIVEVDGGIHALEAVAARDAERQAWLEARGYTVIRIPNELAIYDPHSAVQRVLSTIDADTPTPNPSPQGGGEP